MFSGMLLIFLPLIVGYLIPLKRPQHVHWVNTLTVRLVIVILLLMGLSLAALDNLGSNISTIGVYAATFFVCIGGANLLALPILDKIWPTDTQGHQHKLKLSTMMSESGKLIAAVFVGLAVGLIVEMDLSWVDTASEIILLLLLFLIGIQLRNSGMTLKQIVLNKKGVVIATLIVITSLPGGLLAAWLLDLPYHHGLAMASGFGWYSLAGILMGDGLGPVYGGASFIVELARELVAIMLIPMIISRYPLTAIGYGGATAMDFTLPIIQSTGGIRCVPIAIVSGFILSLLVPVLMLFFLSLGA
ncbi:lysine exporter LysO family protein [Salinivibrio proteolyticus]|uniref:Lysine exporter LysO family protein n=1 Tax=Salinivibrio proteolyticus TaxID=334715 RepID=A0ABY7LBG4_9GAMM|nr:lysine exporter LysO family protein [Salinivibrio proteolyticus]WBA13829.1 lysine exporter LysO family protein [Salinivibrio proteolyticus]